MSKSYVITCPFCDYEYLPAEIYFPKTFFGNPGGRERGRKSCHGRIRSFTVFQGRQFYRILTAMFLHADIMHLAQNLLCLFGVSDIFLASRSAVKYYLVYLGAGILGAAAELFVRYLLKDGTYALGASGAVMGVLGADIALVLKARRGPERPGLSSLLIRLGLLAAINLIPSPGNTDYLGHFFGFSAGFLIGLLL